MADEQRTYVPNRRWYDHISNMTLAIHASSQLPTEIRGIIARNLSETINEHRYRLRGHNNPVVSLGQTRILGLFKAARKLRWYDPEPTLHRAFTLMSTIPEESLTDFATRLLQIKQYVDAQQEHFIFYHEQLLAETVEALLRGQSTRIESRRDGGRILANPAKAAPKSPRFKSARQPR
jgi:hypothetical protein